MIKDNITIYLQLDAGSCNTIKILTPSFIKYVFKTK